MEFIIKYKWIESDDDITAYLYKDPRSSEILLVNKKYRVWR